MTPVPANVEALRLVADTVPSMLAFWDASQRCVYANRAYERWFGVAPEALVGRTMQELLGPLYVLNLPYIQGALRGERQEFEREIPDPHGGPSRHSVATYTPHVVDGHVRGFSVVVSETTRLKQVEAQLREALARVRSLEGLVPVCAWCRRLRSDAGSWTSLEHYVETHTNAQVSHGICEACETSLSSPSPEDTGS